VNTPTSVSILDRYKGMALVGKRILINHLQGDNMVQELLLENGRYLFRAGALGHIEEPHMIASGFSQILQKNDVAVSRHFSSLPHLQPTTKV
jgi:hypothetical protein